MVQMDEGDEGAKSSQGLQLSGAECELDGCSGRIVFNHKRKTQLCVPHCGDRDAMLTQAGKSQAITVNGQRMGLREYLEKLEVDDKEAFLGHLSDFTVKPLGQESIDQSLKCYVFKFQVSKCDLA